MCTSISSTNRSLAERAFFQVLPPSLAIPSHKYLDGQQHPSKVSLSQPYPTTLSPHRSIAFDLSNSLHNNRPLTRQRLRIPIMTLLLTILQSRTLMILQHAMLATEMALTEGAVADDALRAFSAVFESAFYFFRRHAASDGEGHVYC